MLMYKMRKLRSHFLSHLYAVMHDACPSLFYLCGLAELEQNSSYAVALPCLTLLRRYLSLRSWLRSCGQVLGTPNPGETSRSETSCYQSNYVNLIETAKPPTSLDWRTDKYSFKCPRCAKPYISEVWYRKHRNRTLSPPERLWANWNWNFFVLFFSHGATSLAYRVA